MSKRRRAPRPGWDPDSVPLVKAARRLDRCSPTLRLLRAGASVPELLAMPEELHASLCGLGEPEVLALFSQPVAAAALLECALDSPGGPLLAAASGVSSAQGGAEAGTGCVPVRTAVLRSAVCLGRLLERALAEQEPPARQLLAGLVQEAKPELAAGLAGCAGPLRAVVRRVLGTCGDAGLAGLVLAGLNGPGMAAVCEELAAAGPGAREMVGVLAAERHWRRELIQAIGAGRLDPAHGRLRLLVLLEAAERTESSELPEAGLGVDRAIEAEVRAIRSVETIDAIESVTCYCAWHPRLHTDELDALACPALVGLRRLLERHPRSSILHARVLLAVRSLIKSGRPALLAAGLIESRLLPLVCQELAGTGSCVEFRSHLYEVAVALAGSSNVAVRELTEAHSGWAGVGGRLRELSAGLAAPGEAVRPAGVRPVPESSRMGIDGLNVT